MSIKVNNFYIFLSYLLIFPLLLRQGKSADIKPFNCMTEDVEHSELFINQSIGTWYEIARWPSHSDSKCVEIKISEPLNNELKLHVQYRNKQWQYFHELHTLPWNSTGANKQFVINSVVYKFLVFNDYGITVCGYTTDTQESSLYFFNRLPEGLQSLKDEIEFSVGSLHLNVSELLWVDQSKRCSNAALIRTATMLITLLSAFFTSSKLFFK